MNSKMLDSIFIKQNRLSTCTDTLLNTHENS